MLGSKWFAEHVEHLGTDRAAVMAAVKHAVEQGWDVDWPKTAVVSGSVTFYAATDYFAIGEPHDFVYVPLDAPTAQWVADKRGCILPTRKMVQRIWDAAEFKLDAARLPLTPPEFPYTSDMFHVRRLPLHTKRIAELLVQGNQGTSGIVAGHKKDVVLSNRIAEKPGVVVAIYGWQRKDGTPIQGPSVSIKHVASYWDYSHGVRLVDRVCRVNGIDMPIYEALQSRSTYGALSDEGALHVLQYPLPDAVARRTAPPSAPALADEDTAELHSVIMRGSKGDAVKQWQRYLIWRGHDLAPWGADGKFGRTTEAATKAEQKAQLNKGEYKPGVVAEVTWELWVEPPEVLLPVLELDDAGLPPIAYVPAKNYRHATRTPGDVLWIVIHTMEAGEHPGTAENVAAWFAGAHAPMASAHYNIDGDSIVQSVMCSDIAFHAKRGNQYGIGLEHAGYARQTDAGWRDEYSSAMLVLSAKLTARLCHEWEIPVQYVDEQGLRDGVRGITYHGTISRAFKVRGGHTDPGKSFPIDEYLAMVGEELEALQNA